MNDTEQQFVVVAFINDPDYFGFELTSVPMAYENATELAENLRQSDEFVSVEVRGADVYCD